ncbi:MAG TPA: hypothetical protein VKE49_13195, partial [Myxococcaceae bacterium]|nr:hypothetical protein [Myxococcaceae bacterium]
MRWFHGDAIGRSRSLALLLPLLFLGRAAWAEISNIATQVQLTISKSELIAGETASITATLKNPDDNVVVARYPILVTLRRESMTGSDAA